MSGSHRDVYIVQRVRPRGGGEENRPLAYMGKKMGPKYANFGVFVLF